MWLVVPRFGGCLSPCRCVDASAHSLAHQGSASIVWYCVCVWLVGQGFKGVCVGYQQGWVDSWVGSLGVFRSLGVFLDTHTM